MSPVREFVLPLVIGKQRHHATAVLTLMDVIWEATVFQCSHPIKMGWIHAQESVPYLVPPTKYLAPAELTTTDVTWETTAWTPSTVPGIMTPVQEYVWPLVIGKLRQLVTWEWMPMDAWWETTALPLKMVVKKLILLAHSKILKHVHPTKQHAIAGLILMDVVWEVIAWMLSHPTLLGMTPVQEFVLPLVIGKLRQLAIWDMMPMDAGWETIVFQCSHLTKMVWIRAQEDVPYLVMTPKYLAIAELTPMVVTWEATALMLSPPTVPEMKHVLEYVLPLATGKQRQLVT